jgi:hypothetical protein
LKELWLEMPENKDSKDGATETIRNPKLLQEMYIRTATEELPHTMGQAYANAVIHCLMNPPEKPGGSSDNTSNEEGAAEVDVTHPMFLFKNVVGQLAAERVAECPDLTVTGGKVI